MPITHTTIFNTFCLAHNDATSFKKGKIHIKWTSRKLWQHWQDRQERRQYLYKACWSQVLQKGPDDQKNQDVSDHLEEQTKRHKK